MENRTKYFLDVESHRIRYRRYRLAELLPSSIWETLSSASTPLLTTRATAHRSRRHPPSTPSPPARACGIGLGTFGSDHVTPAQWPRRSRRARIGYRHFDCASVYGNEAEVGAALQEVMRSVSSARNCGSLQSCGTTSTARPIDSVVRQVAQRSANRIP